MLPIWNSAMRSRAATLKAFGKIDILVNNGGFSGARAETNSRLDTVD